jgi:hypothetical protein
MKKITTYISLLPALFLAIAIVFSACKKDTDGSPDNKAGTPAFQSVSPVEASGGSVVTVTGTGLGDIRSIVFDNNGVPASVTSTLNTDTHIIFRVPDTAFGGNQNVVLTNSEGKSVSFPFKVIALPIISTAWPTDFQAGSTVTITGNNLDDVISVEIDGTSDAATIVSKARKSLVIQMPASNVDNGKLKITNASGSSVTSIVFVNVDKAVQVFTDDLMNGFQSWSWGGVYEASTEGFVTGTKSMKCVFDAGGFGGLQMGNPGSINASASRYFTFWVKGTDVDYDIQVTINWGPWQSFTVPAKTWTYFKYDLLTAGWTGLDAVNNVTFQIKGADKTFYIDNVMFIK